MRLLGFLLATAVVFLLCYFLISHYFKKPAFDQPTQELMTEQGLNASSYFTVVNSTKTRLKELEQQESDRERQILEGGNNL